ncbi:hypothetical protein HK405_015144, partial [Cladochytrium tenue]
MPERSLAAAVPDAVATVVATAPPTINHNNDTNATTATPARSPSSSTLPTFHKPDSEPSALRTPPPPSLYAANTTAPPTPPQRRVSAPSLPPPAQQPNGVSTGPAGAHTPAGLLPLGGGSIGAGIVNGGTRLACRRHALNPLFSRRYRIVSELGAGGFGLVCAAVRLADMREVSVKFILKARVLPVSAWVRDPDLGTVPLELQHPGVVGFLDFYEDEKYAYLVTALLPASSGSAGGRATTDLFTCIERLGRLPEDVARRVFGQLALAVGYLHARGVVHRDIKDENVLVDSEFNACLIDFGSASLEPRGNPDHLFDHFH